MRVATVSQMKGHRGGAPNREYPKEGTAIRAIMDRFMAAKGEAIVVPWVEHKGRAIATLTDSYGLDIRKAGPQRYMLVGEWFGKVYIDYTEEAEECARSES